MLKWRLKNNSNRSISYDQFRDYTATFKDVIEESLGTECQVIHNLSVDADLDSITQQLWDESDHVMVGFDTALGKGHVIFDSKAAPQDAMFGFDGNFHSDKKNSFFENEIKDAVKAKLCSKTEVQNSNEAHQNNHTDCEIS